MSEQQSISETLKQVKANKASEEKEKSKEREPRNYELREAEVQLESNLLIWDRLMIQLSNIATVERMEYHAAGESNIIKEKPPEFEGSFVKFVKERWYFKHSFYIMMIFLALSLLQMLFLKRFHPFYWLVVVVCGAILYNAFRLYLKRIQVKTYNEVEAYDNIAFGVRITLTTKQQFDFFLMSEEARDKMVRRIRDRILGVETDAAFFPKVYCNAPEPSIHSKVDLSAVFEAMEREEAEAKGALAELIDPVKEYTDYLTAESSELYEEEITLM